MDNIYKQVGSRIKKYREESDLTGEQLSDMADINQGFLSQIENGREKASLETIAKIAKAMGIQISVLFEEKSPVKPCYPKVFESLFEGLNTKNQKLLIGLARDTADKLKKHK